MITTHTDLLNALIVKYKFTSYLEIGVQNQSNNFDRIRCSNKVGVDPECDTTYKITSDDYFKKYKNEFDLIFIDGLHHSDQVKRDFDNSLRCLSDNGVIVLHDCLPINEDTTHVPRDTKIWHGDCYRFALKLCEYDGIDFKSCDKGGRCVWVWRDKTKKGINNPLPVNFETYKVFGKELLRIQDEVII